MARARNSMVAIYAMIADRHTAKPIRSTAVTVITPPPKPIVPFPSPPPSIIFELELGRCEHTRSSIPPFNLRERIMLQCVLDPGHSGACMYENPSNKRKRY
jgi:hypothetical protein